MAFKVSLFLAELKRRKVTRVAVVYVLVGLGVIEGASMILPRWPKHGLESLHRWRSRRHGSGREVVGSRHR